MSATTPCPLADGCALVPGSVSLERELTAVLGGRLSGFLVLCGPPASGKSTLARCLVELDWVHIDKDRDGDRLSPLIMSALGRDPHDRDSTDYRRFGHGLAMRLLAMRTENCGSAECRAQGCGRGALHKRLNGRGCLREAPR